QGKPERNRLRGPWIVRIPQPSPRRRERAEIRGRTGISPVHPFGSVATFPTESLLRRERQTGNPAQKVKAHRFASHLFRWFALSRMKGVAIQAMTFRLAPILP